MKNMFLSIVAVVSVGSVGCASEKDSSSSTSSALTVSGTVSGVPLSGASVYAVGTNGRRLRAAIASNGAFAIRLPTGASYRLLVIQSSTPSMPVLGHVTFAKDASRTQWLGANAATSLNLGTVQPLATNSGGLQPMSEPGDLSGDSAAEAEDSTEEEDDDQAVCNASSAGTEDKELVGQNAPGAELEDKDASEHEDGADDDEGEDVGKNACPG